MPHFSAGGPRGDPTEHLELQERSKADLKRRRLDVRLSLKERNRSRGRALRQAARSTRPVLTMRSGNLTEDPASYIRTAKDSNDETRAIRQTPAILTSGSKQFRLDRVEVL